MRGAHSYPRAVRVRRRREYLRVQRSGLRRHTRHFVVVSLGSDRPGSPARLGVTVSSRVGDAVERNRVKRRVREVFRLHRGRLEEGRDLVVIAKQGAPGLSMLETASELVPALEDLPRTAQERP